MLREQGAGVTEVPLYDTVTAPASEAALARLERGFAAITFTSPSTVTGFLAQTAGRLQIQAQLTDAVIACIGPVTRAAAEAAGFTNTIMPSAYTIDGLISALSAYFGES